MARRSPLDYAKPDPLADLLDELDIEPVVTIKAAVDLPARLYGGNAQTVEVNALDYTLHLDLSKLPQSEAPTANAHKWTVVWDQVANTYKRVEFTSLPGTVGPKGDKGDQGAKGDKGDQGVQGIQGQQGQQGIQGSPGTNGTNGAKGDKGDQGDKGDKGDQGIQGPAGPSVPDGDKGDIVVSASGATWMFDSTVVTAAAKTVLDDTTTAAMRATLGAAPLATISTSPPSGGSPGDVWYQV